MYPLVTTFLGHPAVIEATAVNSNNRRSTLVWQNHMPTRLLEASLPGETIGCQLADILEPSHFPTPVLASDVQPPIVNIAGQPRRAFPPIIPYPDSLDFTIDPATGHPSEGMVYEQQSGTYITPSPYDLERAMGFTPGATAGPVGMIRTAA